MPSLAIISILTQLFENKNKKHTVTLHPWWSYIISKYHSFAMSCRNSQWISIESISIFGQVPRLFLSKLEYYDVITNIFPLFLERTVSRIWLDEILLIYFQEWIQLRDGSLWCFHQVNIYFNNYLTWKDLYGDSRSTTFLKILLN